MSDRTNALTVVLERELRVDDAEEVMAAIRMVKGVAHVHFEVQGPSDYASRWQERHALVLKLGEIVEDLLK